MKEETVYDCANFDCKARVHSVREMQLHAAGFGHQFFEKKTLLTLVITAK